MVLKKGEVYYISNPTSETFGTEIQKDRPAVVLSVSVRGDYPDSSESLGAVVAFFTTKPKVFSDFHIVTHSTGRTATLLLEQMSYKDISRFGKCIGTVTDEEMEAIDKALLKLHGISTAEQKLCEKDNIIKELQRAITEKDIQLNTYQNMLTTLYSCPERAV